MKPEIGESRPSPKRNWKSPEEGGGTLSTFDLGCAGRHGGGSKEKKLSQKTFHFSVKKEKKKRKERELAHVLASTANQDGGKKRRITGHLRRNWESLPEELTMRPTEKREGGEYPNEGSNGYLFSRGKEITASRNAFDHSFRGEKKDDPLKEGDSSPPPWKETY